jgi:hypothetical protein
MPNRTLTMLCGYEIVAIGAAGAILRVRGRPQVAGLKFKSTSRHHAVMVRIFRRSVVTASRL